MKTPRNLPLSSSQRKFRTSRSIIPRIQPSLNARLNRSLHDCSNEVSQSGCPNAAPSTVTLQFSEDLDSGGPLQIVSSSTRRSLNSNQNEDIPAEEDREQFRFLRHPFTMCREQVLRKRGVFYFLVQVVLLVVQMVLAEIVTSEISQNMGFLATSQLKAVLVLIGLSSYKLKACKQCKHTSQILFYFAFGMTPLVSILQLWSCAESDWIQPQTGFLILDICGAFLCCLVCRRMSLTTNLNQSMSQAEIRKYTKKFRAASKKSKEYCVICFTPLEHKQEVISLPCTKDVHHIFHLECGAQWLRNEGLCPVCRKDYKLH